MHVGIAMKFSTHIVCVGLQIPSPMCNRYPTTLTIRNTARFLSDNFSTKAMLAYCVLLRISHSWLAIATI